MILNKPKGITSHDVVYKIKKITGEKVGHTGTLDPLATGVLPILVGKGTLCSKYLINHDKIYQVTLQLGKKTDTADREGNVIKEQIVDIPWENEEKIEKVIQSFIGKQEQTPPMYSAIKVNGKKLYEYARKGQKVDKPTRQIEIYKINILRLNQKKQQIEFQVHCSKGTYIRSLCEDIAERLGTVGYMFDLNRVQVGEFSIKQAISLEQLEKGESQYITIEELFKKNSEIQLEKKRIQPFFNGVKLTMKRPDGAYRIYCEKNFVGIGVVSNGLLKRDIAIDDVHFGNF